MSFKETTLTGVPLTDENFKTPPREMGILPFWFMNGDLDYEEMEWQLKEYKDRGIPGIFLHGRFGLKVPYLSDAWFDRVKFAVEKGKEIGLDIWVYDEMNWPSGTAERQVLKKYPELKQRYMELVPLHIDGPLFTFLEATDHRYVNTGDAHPVAAFGCRTEEFFSSIDNIIDLTQNLSFNKVLPWEAPPGKWSLLYFLEKEIDYYIDTLNPEATERFIELTHDKYKKAVGRDFRSVVPGFYTDEPAMYYYHVGLDNYVVPWTRQMFKIFRQRRGYDLRPHLPALYTSIGKITARVRYDFWRTLTEQYEETYYKRLRKWCENEKVVFTGHLLFEELLRLHARCEGNLFKYLRHMHLIGVDHLYPKIGTEEEPDQHVALKIGSSAAHHFGSTRLLCESMGGTYWDCTLERMKWMANWEYVLGVNLFNNHGYHYSIEGERKRDWPPSQFYHHTWWKYYDRFTEYMARISHILSGGYHVARVLMLYPLTSIWTNYTPQNRDRITDVIERDFNYLSDTLLRLHYDYDYVDEDVLAEARIEDGHIVIRDERYPIFILPPVTHIKRTTYDTLQEFLRQGGNVIGSTLMPVEFVETEDADAVLAVRELFDVGSDSLLDTFGNGHDPEYSVHHHNSEGNFYFFAGRGLNRERPKEMLREILNACSPPDVTISEENVFYLHRVKDEHHVFFLVNNSQAEACTGVEITFEHQGQPELWDPNTGEITPLNVFQIKRGRVSVTLDFPPSGSHVVVMRKPIPETYVESANITITSLEGHTVRGHGNPLGPVVVETTNGSETRQLTLPSNPQLPAMELPIEWQFRLEQDNALLLGSWKMALEGEDGITRGYHQPEFNDDSWLDVKKGGWEMQLPGERDEEVYPVDLWYRTSFHVDHIPPDSRIMIDGFSGSSHRLFVNGHEISEEGKRSWLDAEIREVDIQPFIRKSRNVIAIRLTVEKRTDGIVDLLKVVGKFSLRERNGRLSIAEHPGTIRVGDWTEQGYPFYSGTGIYAADVEVPAEYMEGRVFLEAELGDDIVEVRLNGGLPIVQPWRPHRLDLTGHITAGKNRIELHVTNTLINILEGVTRPSGLFRAPRLIHEHTYELIPNRLTL